jgi:hypothetical protein
MPPHGDGALLMTKPIPKKRTYLLVLDMIKTYNINVEAESLEDAANIGMALPSKNGLITSQIGRC